LSEIGHDAFGVLARDSILGNGAKAACHPHDAATHRAMERRVERPDDHARVPLYRRKSERERRMAVEKWDIDSEHSGVSFTVRHMVITKVHGQFTKWRGSLELDPANLPMSKIEVRIEAGSIDTRDAQRDGYLRSADFLAVEVHPTIEFRSTRIEDVGRRKYKVHGDLTIRGVKREIVLDTIFRGQARDAGEGRRVGFEATTQIDRKDFGLQWNTALEAGGFLVGDTVDVALEIEARKPG
jgi:polyisoprenoid-binding protein YceI